jgi:hypothetical protein
VNNQNNYSWGTESLSLSLPALQLNLSGLSHLQRTELAANYAGFVNATTHEPATQRVECRAYRLCQPLNIPTPALTVDGQYAPIKCRLPDGAGVEITGVNFKARFAMQACLTWAALGVFEERELSGEMVIQNFLRILVAHLVPPQGGAVLHSAGLVFDGRAYVFPGHSNVGKTTLTRKAYASGARVLSDDINLVLPEGAGFSAHAVPFTGEFGRTLDHTGGKASYPLEAIVLLDQGDRIEIRSPSYAEAVARLLACCPFVNTDEHETEIMLDVLTTLATRVPVIALRSSRDDSIDSIMAAVEQQLETLRSIGTLHYG